MSETATASTAPKTSAKKVSTAKSAGANGAPEAYVAKSKGPLTEGSTRMRVFRALDKYTDGLTSSEIRERTGMLEVSGHLSVIIQAELDAKRIRAVKKDGAEHGCPGRDVNVFSLTAAGQKAFNNNKVEERRAGDRVGTSWSPERLKAIKKANAKKAKAKK